MRSVILGLMAGVLLQCFLGCGAKSEPASKEKFITLEEWKKLPPHERNDPYVLERLKKSPKTKR